MSSPSPRKPFRFAGAVRKRTRAPAALVKCPLCRRVIPPAIVDLHMDGGTCARKPRAAPAAPAPAAAEAHFCYDPVSGRCRWSPAQTCACDAGTHFWQRVALRNWRRPGGTLAVLLHAPVSAGSAAPPTDLPAACLTTPADCPSRHLSPALLKSALQKNVRRGRVQPAVRIAIALMRKTSLSDLLRRLQVIVIEDAMLVPSFPVLTWLMAAIARGYQPRRSDVVRVLEAVDLICRVKVKDIEAVDGDASSAFVEENQSDEALHADDNLSVLTLVRSLQVRASYGGMKGDVDMLQRSARVWASRFVASPELWCDRMKFAYSEAKVAPETSFTETALSESGHLLKFDVPLQAIDFHCSPICTEIIRVLSPGGKSPVFSRFGFDHVKDGIEGLMWTFWSSRTNKRLGWATHEEASLARGACRDEGRDRALWETELEPKARVWSRSLLRSAGL